MRNAIAMAVALLAVFALAGCAHGPVGTWKMVEMIPAAEQTKFDMKSITFEKNGNYMAEVAHGGELKEMKGTYEFDETAHRVTFNDTTGKTREYRAEVCQCNKKLYVWDLEGKKWKATLKRQ